MEMGEQKKITDLQRERDELKWSTEKSQLQVNYYFK